MDGELVDNLPTNLTRQIGLDVVIAIDLQVSPTAPDDIQSLFSVFSAAQSQ